MKCPKCSKSLWFSRSYCPFCKTAIPEPQKTGIPPSPKLNWLVLIGWSAWFAHTLAPLADSQIWDLTFSSFVRQRAGILVGIALGGPVFVGLGGWLALRLYDSPDRSRTISFLIICLLLLWKYSLANIVMPMLPQFGGHTLAEGLDFWWSYSTSSPGRFLVAILTPPFLIFSIVYWPVYCRWVIRPKTEFIATGAPAIAGAKAPAKTENNPR